MNKLKTLALAGLVAVSSVAVASEARIDGFGASKAFIADVQDIFSLPGVVASHADTMYLEFGKQTSAAIAVDTFQAAAAKPYGGAHLTLGPGVLAVWSGKCTTKYTAVKALNLNNPVLGVLAGDGVTPAAIGTFAPENIVNQLELIYAFGLSDSLTLGLGFSKGAVDTSGTVENAVPGATTVKTEGSGGDFGILVGAEVKEVGPIALLEAGVTFNSASALTKNDTTKENKKTSSASDLGIRVGADLKGDAGAFQRIEVQLGTQAAVSKLEYAVAPVANSYVEGKQNNMNWALGWAAGKAGAKGMGLMGLTLDGYSNVIDMPWNGTEVNKTTTSNLNLAVSAGGEVKVKEWLQARAGIDNSLWNNKTTVTETGAAGSVTKNTTNAVASKNATLSAGLSLLLGDVTIDGVLNQDVLYTGTYLISGISESLSSKVSASWNFGGSKE